jgi:2-dehydro-3-deoxyphosphogalactonate aldolase
MTQPTLSAKSFPRPPLVAILRGLAPDDAEAVGEVLFGAGLRIVEVPLNRPGALEGIATLVRLAPPGALVGAGTVMTVDQIDAVQAAGGGLIVMPHCDPVLIRHAVARGLLVAPGVFTATEAFAALTAGADALKLFPAEVLGPAGLKALRSVLPDGVRLWPVGGVDAESMPAWVAAGATGLGIGSALFKPGVSSGDLRTRARALVEVWQRLTDGVDPDGSPR